jgi:radical SAM superfamily enzyme YgiQ (UPF0313 family)
MKILFLYQYEYLEPIGIMSLLAYLRRSGYECDFIDLALERDYLKKIKEAHPDIIAYSITTGKHFFYQRLNVELKKKMKFFAIFGGPHATFFPEFIEEEGVDAICRGEGEYALVELAAALKDGRDCASIKNLWVKQGEKIYRNDVRPLIEDLDSLPFPDREIINKYNHYKKLHRRMVLTGRGCPYSCTYCFNHSYNDLYGLTKSKIVRKRSVAHVIEELKEISNKYSPRRFQFIDDTFILDKSWCSDFSKKYKEEISKPFIAYTRVNIVDDEVIKSLKEGGCITILYAIESGNDIIRNSVLKRNITEKQILDAVGIYKKYGLKTFAQNMVGLPDETLKSAFETVRLNAKCKPDYAWSSIFQPYPRTELYAYCEKKNYLTNEPFDETYYKKSILNIPYRAEFENLHHLFSLAVAFPFLEPLIRLLIKLPLGSFYYFLWNIHRVWCYTTKVKWIDVSELFIFE